MARARQHWGCRCHSSAIPASGAFADFGDSVVLCPGDYNRRRAEDLLYGTATLTRAQLSPNAPTGLQAGWMHLTTASSLCGNLFRLQRLALCLDWDGPGSYLAEVQRAWKFVSTQTLNEKRVASPPQALFWPGFVMWAVRIFGIYQTCS